MPKAASTHPARLGGANLQIGSITTIRRPVGRGGSGMGSNPDFQDPLDSRKVMTTRNPHQAHTNKLVKALTTGRWTGKSETYPISPEVKTLMMNRARRSAPIPSSPTSRAGG
jgi:hypothetical protein